MRFIVLFLLLAGATHAGCFVRIADGSVAHSVHTPKYAKLSGWRRVTSAECASARSIRPDRRKWDGVKIVDAPLSVETLAARRTARRRGILTLLVREKRVRAEASSRGWLKVVALCDAELARLAALLAP